MLPSACTTLLPGACSALIRLDLWIHVRSRERSSDLSHPLGCTAGRQVHITLSHEVGQLGLLEREGASVLNAALRPLASRVIPAFQLALQEAGIQARLQLTSNNGTLISAQAAQQVGPCSNSRSQVHSRAATAQGVGHVRADAADELGAG